MHLLLIGVSSPSIPYRHSIIPGVIRPIRHSGSVDTRISSAACQDLRRIDDPAVRTELVHIALTELRGPPRGSTIEGRLTNRPNIWWRRGVRWAGLNDFESWDTPHDDADDYTCQAFNFLLLYRWATSNEKIDHQIVTSVDNSPDRARLVRRGDVLLVVKVWDNTVVADGLT